MGAVVTLMESGYTAQRVSGTSAGSIVAAQIGAARRRSAASQSSAASGVAKEKRPGFALGHTSKLGHMPLDIKGAYALRLEGSMNRRRGGRSCPVALR